MSEGDSVQTRSQTAKANAVTGSNTASPGDNTDPADNSPPLGDGGGGDASVGDVKNEARPGDASTTASTGLGGSAPPGDPGTRERTALFAACQRLRIKLKSVAQDVEATVTTYHSGDLEPSHENRIMVVSYIKTIRRVASELRTQHERVLQTIIDPDHASLVNSHCNNVELTFDESDRAEAAAEELLECISKEMPAPSQGGDGSRPAGDPELSVRLPAHDLPKFSGNCVDWPVFWNQFRIAVHDRSGLPVTHKFVYLKQCLSGEALDLVKSLLIAEASYGTALTLLRQRFEDTRLILRDYIDALINVPPAQANNPASLRRLVSVFQDKYTGLLNAGVKTGYLFLTHMLNRKLDHETKRAWEMAQLSTAKLDEWKRTAIPPSGAGGPGSFGGSSHGSGGFRTCLDRTPTPATQQETWDAEFPLLMKFLFERLQIAERTAGRMDATRRPHQNVKTAAPAQHQSTSKPGSGRPNQRHGDGGTGSAKQSKPQPTECPVCSKKDHHLISKCPTFQKMSVSQRYNAVRQAKACFNCLSTYHGVRECTSTFACKECGRKGHHTMLHSGGGNKQTACASQPENKPAATPQANNDPVGGCATTAPPATSPPAPSAVADGIRPLAPATGKSLTVQGPPVFLCTAEVPIISAFGHQVTVRAMFDTGSQVELISAAAAKKIGHDVKPTGLQIQGVGGGKVSAIKGQISFIILIPGGRVRMTCYVLPEVVGPLPTTQLSSEILQRFDGYTLADPKFQEERPVDLLIGMGYFNTFVLDERVQFDSMYLQNTLFGWAVTGRPTTKRRSSKTLGVTGVSTIVAASATGTISIPHDSDRHVSGIVNEPGLQEFEKFWTTEEPPETDTVLKPEAKFCVEHYDRTTTYDDDGRARCALPFKPDSPKLGNSRAQAIRRLLNMESRLAADDKLGVAYRKFMKEFIDMGHLELVPEDEVEMLDQDCYYLPHHGVLKESSTTTKLRVVFDASAKSTNGVSLNQILAVGPRVQHVIFKILVRFRFHVIGLAADVAKMYRQVGLDNEGKDFHRLCWRESVDDPIRVYRMTRVTYGVTSSAYHAIRTLQDAAEFCQTHDAKRAIWKIFTWTTFWEERTRSRTPSTCVTTWRKHWRNDRCQSESGAAAPRGYWSKFPRTIARRLPSSWRLTSMVSRHWESDGT